MKTRKHSEGFILTGVLALLVIVSIVGGAFVFAARNSIRTAERWEGYDQCLLAIQTALEARKHEIYQDFYDTFMTNRSMDAYDVLAYYDTNVIFAVTDEGVTRVEDGGLSSLQSAGRLDSAVTVTVHTASGAVNKNPAENEAFITMTNIATATYNGITRRIQENVFYEYDSSAAPPGGPSGGPHGVFDYIFFIDNDAFFSGVNANYNGDVRANENIELKYSSILLNGDAYAVGIIDTKKDYKNLNWSKYQTQGHSDRARPGSYTDFNRSNPDTYWERGYNEGSTYYEGVERMELPYIGPLDEYKEYAIAQNGTIRGAKTVDAVWGDDVGEDVMGISGSEGCLFLEGTAANPIVISNIVVADKDVYIKGYYTGQGTIYAGRNIHIIGDVVALNPPSWPKPDSTPHITAHVNKDKDFLGLCAKGSLVFADYHKYANLGFQPYLKAPYTQSHAVDPTDTENGYVSFWQDGIPYFNGDYTQADGSPQTDGDPRIYYEATLGEVDFLSLGVSDRVRQFDCVMYANHLFMGYFDENSVVNGSIVCRDEALKVHGNLWLNWDIRLGSDSQDGQHFAPWLPGMLPPIPGLPYMVRWVELPVDDV